MPRSPRAPLLTHIRRYLLGGLALVGSGLLVGCQAVLFAGINATVGHNNVVVQRNVFFDATHALALDVYHPRDAHGAPVVVFFYGGSWKSGQRQWYRWVGEALAQRGLVVVIPDYRHWPQVRLHGFMDDAARAVAWTHARAAEYGGDADHLFLMGHSAGAHIAALLATDPSWLAGVGLHSQQLAGFIGLAGPYDFLPLKDPDFVDMFGSTHAAQLRSQPVHFAGGNDPPMLLLQGAQDKVVDPRNATSLAAAESEHGASVQVHLYPGIGHTAILLAMSRPFRDKAPVLDDALKFIHAQLTLRSEPVATPHRDTTTLHRNP